MTIKVVTDSTSDIPHELATSYGIEVVPLKVRFGDDEYRDGIDLTSDEFFQRLVESDSLPTTSQPSMGDFVEAYERLGPACDGIVSVHISSKVSATFATAVQASKESDFGCPVVTVDSRNASMALGLVAIAAAEAASAGGDLAAVKAAAEIAAQNCLCYAMLDTLEFLEKGGRIGKARAMLGTILRIKPLITVHDGEVHELAKERTFGKGVARLRRAAKESAPVEKLAVMYSTNPDDALLLSESISDLLPDDRSPIIARFGPVLGTYVGPNSIGIGLVRA